MEKYSAKEARDNFSEIVSKAAHGRQRIVITKSGKDAVAIVPMPDLELLAEIERLIDISEAQAAIKEAKKAGGTVTLAQLKKDLGL